MAGISVTLDGDTIQLSFSRGDQQTAVVMDASAARSLVHAVSQLLAAMGEEDADDEPVDAGSVDIGLDDEGHAVLQLQAGEAAPFLLRLQDEEARHIAHALLEILSAPRDARLSQGGH